MTIVIIVSNIIKEFKFYYILDTRTLIFIKKLLCLIIVGINFFDAHKILFLMPRKYSFMPRNIFLDQEIL